jgi:hypothetical protein
MKLLELKRLLNVRVFDIISLIITFKELDFIFI